MPMDPPPKIGKRESPMQWVHIDDFSPGCYDGSNISSEHPILSSVPLGAANLDTTFACSAIAGGALGPLPTIVDSAPFSALSGLPGASTEAVITCFITTPQLDDGNYEIFVVYEADDGTTHYVAAFSFEAPGGPLNGVTGPTNNSASTPGFFGAPYPAFTRMSVGGTGNPPPVLVFPGSVATDANGANGHLWVYPPLLAPTTFDCQDLIVSASSTTGQVICYGNRVICLVGQDYSWPAGGGINTNENINYTDPPESSAYGDQLAILSIETPWGYGAWGTESVGELMLIKKYGGGVILYGDINDPTSVIRMPSVQSTGDMVGRACPTLSGLIYCSQDQGAWVWDGGNTSQKISDNIDDKFFDLESGVIQSNNYGFFVERWQKWIMFSGNVIYDTEKGSWWKLYPRLGLDLGSLVGRDIFWYSLTQNGNQMATAPLLITDNAQAFFSTFDNEVPSPEYQWESLPIHVNQNADRVLDVRQIIVRASDPSNTGTATIGIACPNGTFSDGSVAADDPIGLDPTAIRFNVGMGAQGLDDIIIQLQAHNPGGSAPIVHSIDVGYVVRAPVGVAN